MFNIPSHQENVNQNGIEIPSHFSQIGYHQENKQETLGRCREKGTLIEISKSVHPLWESVWKVLKTLKNRTT
jgi:hypothetical protein